MNALLRRLGVELPIIQAPMAGVSSPAMAAAVGNAGALGSIGVGATNVAGARKMIAAIREAPTVRSMSTSSATSPQDRLRWSRPPGSIGYAPNSIVLVPRRQLP